MPINGITLHANKWHYSRPRGTATPQPPTLHSTPVATAGTSAARTAAPRPAGRGNSRRLLGDGLVGLRRAAAQQPPPAAVNTGPRRRVPQSIARAAHPAWAAEAAERMRKIMDAAASAIGPDAAQEVHAALAGVCSLPQQVLADNNSSKGRPRRILARLSRLAEGLPLNDENDDEDDIGGAPRAHTTRGQRRPVSEDQRTATRIQRFLELSSVTRAARALASQPMADARDPRVVAALRAKHPAAEPAPLLGTDTPALQIDDEIWRKTLERVRSKLGAAGGPSGWTFEHVIAAVDSSTAAFSAALAFINLMLSGELPRHSGLLDSTLIGLTKPDGSVRPIAIGEVWYRLATQCIITVVADEGRALAPLQLGVGVPGGAEAFAHGARAALLADPEAYLLTLDVENAFNSVSRSAIFEAVQDRVPQLLKFVQWAYGGHTDLHIMGAAPGTPPVQSQTGVRQGDPLGPLLFALALQGPLERTCEVAPAASLGGYLDDLRIVGRAPQLRAAFPVLRTGALGIGLRMRPSKMALTGGPGPGAAALLATELGVQHSPDGVLLCGTPTGTDAFVEAAVSERADAVIEQVNKLMRLPLRAQSRCTLLRASLALRLAHYLRTLPWERVSAATRRVEAAIVTALATIFRVSQAAEATREEQLACQQMGLPLRHGGLGLRHVTALQADAALVASVAMAHATLAGGGSACDPFAGPARAPLEELWHSVFDRMAGQCDWGPEDRAVSDRSLRDVLPFVQRTVSRAEDDRKAAEFLAGFGTATDWGKGNVARMHSVASGPSAAWLTALQGAPSTRLGDEAVVCGGRHLLGMGVPVRMVGRPCTCGAEAPARWDHYMVCRHTAGTRTIRHDIKVQAWCHLIRKAGCATSMEPTYSHLLPGNRRGAAGQCRGDILAVLPSKLAVLDCVVTHPTAASYVDATHKKPGVAAARAEQDKRRDFEKFGDGADFDFVPLASESFGRLGLGASRFLSALGDIAEGRAFGVSKERFVRHARQELSCALVRGNALVYSRFMMQFARITGKQFTLGLDHPVDTLGHE